MQIETIQRESIPGTDTVFTNVVISGVDSQCILVRQLMTALGRPGVDNDMELMGSGDRWIISWTQPNLTLDETRTVLNATLARC